MSQVKLNVLLVIMSLLLFVNNSGQAHETSFSYLEMHYDKSPESESGAFDTNNLASSLIKASWHVSLADIQQIVDMDIDRDQRILGWELRAQLPLILERLNGVLMFPQEADCQWSYSALRVRPTPQKTDVIMDVKGLCGQVPDTLQIDTLKIVVPQDFSDPLLYQVHLKQRAEWVIDKGVVEPGQVSDIILSERQSESTAQVSFFYFVIEGVKHILIGADHLVFLMLLLFSAVWRRGDLVEFNFPALKKLLAYTGCFTIAHSITLALGWWQLTPIPMKWIEVLIALTIVWSAVAVLKQHKPLALSVVFIFGLIHGFGFASVLLDSPAADYYGTTTLLGFNVGVELGQFLFLCVTALLMRALSIKQTDYFARSGAFSALAVAGIWVFERTTGFALIS